MLHDDLMTPGVIYWDDPPPEDSGMVRLQLDSQGRLLYFERIPAQRQTPAKGTRRRRIGTRCSPPPDSTQSKFQPAEPALEFVGGLGHAHGVDEDTPRPRRIEAASLRGEPGILRRPRTVDQAGAYAAIVGLHSQ